MSQESSIDVPALVVDEVVAAVVESAEACSDKIQENVEDVSLESKEDPLYEEKQAETATVNLHSSNIQDGDRSSSGPPSISRAPNSDLERLHSFCISFAGARNRVNDEKKIETTESILQLLVTDDMSNIRTPDVLKSLFINYLNLLPSIVISEVLSVLIAIVKKSVFHLESTRGLLVPCINHLLTDSIKTIDENESNIEDSQTKNDSLTKHFLREWINLLIAHSCDVEELQTIFKFSEIDPTLLSFVQQANLKQRNRPSAFFAFPGTKGSLLSMPPVQKWPIQLGWSFSTWFFLEPKSCAQPYLFNFKTGKSGLGYSAHFTGNCLVLTSIRVKGKGVQHCIAYEFPSYKWIHCAITYHNKWRASEIKVYINGQLSANIDMPWQVQTNELFDKCFIGGSGSITTNERAGDLHCFCGQMSAIYLFNEGLSPAQICAIHRLGPSYMGQFKYSNESYVNLPPQICKVLYEEKLAPTLFCLFTPIAVDSGALCIQLAPFKSSTTTPAPNYFISAPHAALQGRTKAIITQPICSTLQSVGCTSSLLPLLDVFVSKNDTDACSSLIGFLCDLLESSPHWFANEIVQNNGFVIMACALAKNARDLLSEKLLDVFLNLTRTLLTTSSTSGDSMLLKHLMDNILINPYLWIYSQTKLQIKLYSYLATEFLHGTRHSNNKYTASNSSNSNPYVAYNPTSSAATAMSNQSYPLSANSVVPTGNEQTKSSVYASTSPIVTDLLFGEVRRVSTVLQALHALKYYYWHVEEEGINHKACNQKLRPNLTDLSVIRSHILTFTKELIVRASSTPLDETQGLLNYLSSCVEPENLLDVMEVLSSLLIEYPVSLVAALDQKQGIRVFFTLIGSKSEKVRIKALKLLGLFLSQCSLKKKQDIMGPNNLFMLLFDRLRIYRPLTPELYRALISIAIEEDEQTGEWDLSKKRVENSIVLKVIATLLHEERGQSKMETNKLSEVVDLRNVFLNDLWNLIVNSRENRRTILQMSVWQHWLINLIDSTVSDSQLVRDQVLSIFRVLLYHAIRYEYGGWRVWIDTLAIIHTKVSFDQFCKQLSLEMSYMSQRFEDTGCTNPSVKIPSGESPKDKQINASSEIQSDDHEDGQETETQEKTPQQTVVSSISEYIPQENSALRMEEGVDETDGKSEEVVKGNDAETIEGKPMNPDESLDSPDLAPSRAYRKVEPRDETMSATQTSDSVESLTGNELNRQPSLTSIPLDESESEPHMEDADKSTKKQPEGEKVDNVKEEQVLPEEVQINQNQQKATASPAFRIPEFKWSGILIKLLNDLMFSIECDLYHWRCMAKCANLDLLPFTPKSGSSVTVQSANSSSSTSSRPSTNNLHIETILQRAENQIYIINIVHFISQLADNIIIASGGLLPLLADATGGTRSTSNRDTSNQTTCEGLTLPQANSLLYRLTNMVDLVIFTATHINLGELEADKNTTGGGILRQCLRLACTVTVKNCLIIRNLNSRISLMGGNEGDIQIMSNDLPKDIFDSYQGCSLLSANGLFEKSALSLEHSDLIADIEYSPHQTPNTSSMPSILPFQSTPIRDPNKLLQNVDISRIQECIYYELNCESRQSQFLALSSLYFISVLMVSKYRDIIEPKQKSQHKESSNLTQSPSVKGSQTSSDSGFQIGSSVSSIESNLLSFGKMHPNAASGHNSSSSSGGTLTDLLTKKLENTLDSICPLLKSIMCNFSQFLSKTLVGSHGQDLVNKEIDRTFKRPNTSPVELVMLLCSQEWQNTLQKNAGLAFIELINEGRVLSHGMKDHIVRVAMEAEFILSRLRADDVSKHEHFNLACTQTLSSRVHEEVLINSLIGSATRRDYVVYNKFKEVVQTQRQRNYKLDIWEDDDRRRRRFVIDSWDDSQQSLYCGNAVVLPSKDRELDTDDKTATKRILELQQTLELSGIDDHTGSTNLQDQQEDKHGPNEASNKDGEDDCEDEDDSEEEEDEQNNEGSTSAESENAIGRHKTVSTNNRSKDETAYTSDAEDKLSKAQGLYNQTKALKDLDLNDPGSVEGKVNEVWDYEECSSVSDFNGSVVFAAECSLIWNIFSIPGVFQITNHDLYFEPNQNISDAIDMFKKNPLNNEDEDAHIPLSGLRTNQNDSSSQQDETLRKIDLKVLRYCDFLTCNGKIHLNDIRAIFSRHYLLQPHALEIFLAQRTSAMFAFPDFDTVKRAIKYLPPVGVGIKYGIPQSRRASLMAPRQLFSASNMTQKWQKREIGNFQYLMFLNTIAGRSYQDINQYPVFPWILTNYETEELDLNLPTNFRDLSKPVGALNSKRRAEFIERYQSWDNPKVPAFHYGTHYSTAAFTLNWLCRIRGACNSAYLAMQDGKYEEDSRLFLSIGDAWVSSLVEGQQNVKELIPEFFYLPDMFKSNLGLPEVEFPPWAKSAEQFVRLHRLALESELVSCQLHQWIDLIFGYKQRGPEAVNAVNTFYYLTYQGNVNLNMIQDPTLRDAIETQIKHFGQTPSQLTTEPHPPRFSALHVSPLMFSSSADDVNKIIKFPFNTPVVHISSCISNYMTTSSVVEGTSPANPLGNNNQVEAPSSVLTITSNNQYQIHKWMSNAQTGQPLTMDPQLDQNNGTARRQLVDVDDICTGISLKIHNYEETQTNDLSEISWPSAHYVVTLDGRYIIMGSFYDNSFRVFTTESGKLCQVIYGHRGPLTCMARSDGNAAADFYLATGSKDCSVLLWTWNEKYSQVEGSGVSAVHNPLPKLTISGHTTPVLSIVICAELGLIISASKNLILVHTTTSGENLLEINVLLPDMLDKTSFEMRERGEMSCNIQDRPQVRDKHKTILEASMLGDGYAQSRSKGNVAQLPNSATTIASGSRCTSSLSNISERFNHLKELCKSDYFITNLQLARELAFIVCIALPPAKKKHRPIEDSTATKSSVALLMTFNLKGSLMESTTVGQSISCPRLGDVCSLQMTRDGEHLIVNDSPTSIKVYRTFDLQILYAYTTNDITGSLSDDQNKIRSLALLDNRHILVGLENGKLIVYNADFKNL